MFLQFQSGFSYGNAAHKKEKYLRQISELFICFRISGRLGGEILFQIVFVFIHLLKDDKISILQCAMLLSHSH